MKVAGASTRRAGIRAIWYALLALPLALAVSVRAFCVERAAAAAAETTAADPAAAPSPAATASRPPAGAAGTVEIPPLDPVAPPQASADGVPDRHGAPGANAGGGADAAANRAVEEREIEEYEAAQNPAAPPAANLHSLQEFMNQGADSSPIGVELREDRRQLKSGQQADGLLILKVYNDSPAAAAGLRAYRTIGHSVLEGTAVAAAMFFPPAVLAIALIDETHIGESYDMIIGVDGKRVINYLDFEDQLRDVKPGDVVYLGIVRDGKRMQVPVLVPATATSLLH